MAMMIIGSMCSCTAQSGDGAEPGCDVFKTQNGRRFFRMAPLHHHFELGGWKETKVVGVFFGVTAVLCALAILIF